jgi:octaprenyl-diphosphate synthase
MERLEQAPEDFARAMSLMERHGALRDTVERARHYGAMARDSLALFPDSETKQALSDVIDFCIDRAY